MTSALRLASDPPEQSPGARREHEILEAARSAFAVKGFDGASMQDIARAAGMSVGNFYRYFPSKTAIIHALIRRDIAIVEDQFAQIVAASAPLPAIRSALYVHVHHYAAQKQDAAIWAEMHSHALRNTEIAEMIHQAEAEIIGCMLRAFALFSGQSLEWIETHCKAHARMMIMFVKISAMQTDRGSAEESAAFTQLIMTQIDALLDQIASAQIKDTIE